MRLTAEFVKQAVAQISNIVEGTGYPVAGFILESSGIATREQVRALKRKGHVNEVRLKMNNSKRSQGTMVKAYYGADYPRFLLSDEQEVTSEEQSD